MPDISRCIRSSRDRLGFYAEIHEDCCHYGFYVLLSGPTIQNFRCICSNRDRLGFYAESLKIFGTVWFQLGMLPNPSRRVLASTIEEG